jgi:two-component system, OmpR family, sensor histidine kinase BaeS
MIRAVDQHATTQQSALRRFALRSLTVKLTFAFLVVGLLGALLVSFFVSQGTQRAFDQFVRDRGHPAMLNELAAYHAEQGSWEGVASLWQTSSEPTTSARPSPPRPVVLDADRTVVLGDERFLEGTRVTEDDVRGEVPIIDGTTVIGWLIDRPPDHRQKYGSPEADFIQRVQEAITYSAIGATGIALLLGIVLASTMTRPLRELTAATQRVARGMLGQQVTVRSSDELGALAASFNQMSADLAHASTLRRQMTADIAHDLRTPLSVILGYTEALRDGKLPPEQDIFDTLHIEAQHLQHLINDLRTLSLADAGELPLTRQIIEPQALVERAAATYRIQAQAQGITLETYCAPSAPRIDVDVERMAQVLGNLLSNALRWTPTGGTVFVRADAAKGGVRLKVTDTGAGIAAEDLPHIFERFYRADAARRRNEGSSGLGLAIAKGIVEAHGGTISAASEPGNGTTFTITLSAAHERAEPEFA